MAWEMLCEQRWLGRVEDAMNDLIAALVDSGAGMVTAKAIGYDDRCNESFSVVLLDDQYVGAWVDCATGDALFGVRRVTEATAPSCCPRGEHVHKDGTRWPTGDSCGGDPSRAPSEETT